MSQTNTSVLNASFGYSETPVIGMRNRKKFDYQKKYMSSIGTLPEIAEFGYPNVRLTDIMPCPADLFDSVG